MKRAALMLCALLALAADTADAAETSRASYWAEYERHVWWGCGGWERVVWDAIAWGDDGQLRRGPLTRHAEFGVEWHRAICCTLYWESAWKPDVRGIIDPRDRGIAQINAYWNPHVTDAQAFNPRWSIQWMADFWHEGRHTAWHAHRKCRDGLQTLDAVPVRDARPLFAPLPRWTEELRDAL